MKCVQCQFDNDANDAFCSSCGATLLAAVRACPDCGAANAPDATFCQMCATPLAGRLPGTSENPTHRLDMPASGLPLQKRRPRLQAPLLLGIATLLVGYGAGATWRAHAVAIAIAPSVPAPSPSSRLVPPLDPTVTPSPLKRLQGVLSASSYQPPFVPALAADGDPQTAWRAASGARSTAAWLSVSFPNRVLVCRLGVAGGEEGSRIRKARFEFDEGSEPHVFEDGTSMQYIDLRTPAATQKVRLVVESVYANRASAPFSVREFEVWGQ